MKKIADRPALPQSCRHPEHDPPGMIVLPPGTYEHTCPGCKRVQTIVVSPPPTAMSSVYRGSGWSL
jgi:hypothetical protein